MLPLRSLHCLFKSSVAYKRADFSDFRASTRPSLPESSQDFVNDKFVGFLS